MTTQVTQTNEKHDAFRRLADARTNRVLKQLQLLANLSNKSIYEYSEGEVVAMLEAIESKLIALRESFSRRLTTTDFSVSSTSLKGVTRVSR